MSEQVEAQGLAECLDVLAPDVTILVAVQLIEEPCNFCELHLPKQPRVHQELVEADAVRLLLEALLLTPYELLKVVYTSLKSLKSLAKRSQRALSKRGAIEASKAQQASPQLVFADQSALRAKIHHILGACRA